MTETTARCWRSNWHAAFANGRNLEDGWAVCRYIASGERVEMRAGAKAVRFGTGEHADAAAVAAGGVSTLMPKRPAGQNFDWPATTTNWRRLKSACAEFRSMVFSRD